MDLCCKREKQRLFNLSEGGEAFSRGSRFARGVCLSSFRPWLVYPTTAARFSAMHGCLR